MHAIDGADVRNVVGAGTLSDMIILTGPSYLLGSALLDAAGMSGTDYVVAVGDALGAM